MRHSRTAEEAGGLTVDRTLAPGDVLRLGTVGPYRSLSGGPGEPHVRHLGSAMADPPRCSF